MPICPGCERSVPYDQLDVHERYCDGIWGQDSDTATAVERLDRRLQQFKVDVDERLETIERRRRESLIPK